jgi:hypothetical protein
MLVATFNDRTGWRGKTITFDDEQFVLEGHGPVSPKNIMKYDAKGQLEWAGDEMRAWVGSQASATTKPRTVKLGSSSGRSPQDDALEGAIYERAWYIGGLTGLESQCEGALRITTKRMGILRGFDEQLWASIKTSAITHVVVESEQVSQSRIRATVLFGIAGLATRAAKDRTYLTAYLTSGDFATYMVDGFSATEVRADIAPILKRAGVPFDEPVSVAQRSEPRRADRSIVDELERLATLHRAGSITDEEFAAFKAKLME